MRIKTSNGAIVNVNNMKRSITIEGIELGSDCQALVSKHPRWDRYDYFSL